MQTSIGPEINRVTRLMLERFGHLAPNSRVRPPRFLDTHTWSLQTPGTDSNEESTDKVHHLGQLQPAPNKAPHTQLLGPQTWLESIAVDGGILRFRCLSRQRPRMSNHVRHERPWALHQAKQKSHSTLCFVFGLTWCPWPSRTRFALSVMLRHR
jgi:hypothetical protein